MKKLLFFTVLIALLSVSNGFSQLFQNADTTYFQGFLTDSKGAPVDGTTSATITLYDITGAAILPPVFDDNVQVVKGYFSVPFNWGNTSIDVLAKATSAELQIDHKAFSPRIYLGSVPKAKIARVADSSLKVTDYSITNIQISTTAAIDGTKINPDFGNQTVKGKDGIFTNSIQSPNAYFDNLTATTVTLKNINVEKITVTNNLDVQGNITNSTKSPITFSDHVEIINDLNVDNNLIVAGNTTTNTLDVTGSSTFGTTATFKQQVSIEGDLSVTGNSTFGKSINGEINVNGNANFHKKITVDDTGTFQNGINVTGDITATGATVLYGDLTVNGNLKVTGATYLQSVTLANAQITGKLTLQELEVTGASVLKNLTVQANTTLNTITVTSTANFEMTTVDGDFTVTTKGKTNLKNTTVDGNLDVTGKTNLGSTLDVSGITNIKNTLDVSEKTTLKNSLDVTGKTTITGDLSVSNKTTTNELEVTDSVLVKNNLRVGGKIYVNGGLDIKGDLDVSGTGKFQNITVANVTNLKTLNVSGASNLKDTKIDGTAEINGKTTITGDLSVSNKTTTKDLEVTSTASLKSTVISGDLNVTNKTTTKELEVIDTAKLQHGVISGDMNVKGNLNIDSMITGKGKMVLSASTISTLNPPVGDNKLYVDGKTYFKEGVIAGSLTLDNSLTVNGSTTLATLTVSGASTFNTVNAKGKTNLNVTEIKDSVTVRGTAYIDNLQATNANFSNITTGNLDVSNDARIVGKMSVTGATYLHETNVTGNVNVSNEVSTANLTVTSRANLNSGLITGNMDVYGNLNVKSTTNGVNGELNVDGKITGKGQMVLSSSATLNPPLDDNTKLYVDGKTYFKEGIIAGGLTLDNSLVVNGSAQFKDASFANIEVSSTATINITKFNVLQSRLDMSTASVALGNNAIQNYELESVNNADKITVNNLYECTDGYDILGIEPENTNLNNLAIAIFRWMEDDNHRDYVPPKIGIPPFDMGGWISKTVHDITTNTITVHDITTNTITAHDITTNNLTSETITTNTITAHDITTNNLTSETITTNTITAHEITTNTLTSETITTNTLTANSITTNTLTTNDITTNTLTAHDITTNTLTTNVITTNTINSDVGNFNNLNVTNLNVALETTTNNLTVTGKFNFTGNPGDLTLPDPLNVNNLNVQSETTTQNLTVTGKFNFTGDPGNLTLPDPLSVNNLNVSSATTTQDLTVTGKFNFTGGGSNFILPDPLNVTNLNVSNTTATKDLIISGAGSFIDGSTMDFTNCTVTNIPVSAILGLNLNAGYWQPPYSGSSDIFYSSGNVGINNQNPGNELDVTGTIHCSNLIVDSPPWSSGGTNYWNQNGSGIQSSVNYVGIGTSPSSSYGLNVGGTIHCSNLVVDSPPWSSGGTNYWTQSGNTLSPSNSSYQISAIQGYSSTIDAIIGTSYGSGTQSAGIAGINYCPSSNGSGNKIGVYGWSDNGYGGYFHSQSTSKPAVFAESNTGYGLQVWGYSRFDAGTSNIYANSHEFTGSTHQASVYVTNNTQDGIALKAYHSGATGWGLYIDGRAFCTAGIWTSSDLRLKKDIFTIEKPLNKILNLRGVEYSWKDTVKYPSTKKIGFIAQEIVKIIPEVVSKDGDYYSVEYAPITALLVEGMKEQQHQIDSLRARLNKLEEFAVNSSSEFLEMNGTTNLKDGAIEIDLKKEFQGLDFDKDVSVILTPKGECNGLFVAKTENGKMTIKESAKGKSNAGFYYSIKAKQTKEMVLNK